MHQEAHASDSAKVLVSVPRFARLVDLSERTVWALLSRERLPSIRVGRRRLVPLRAGLLALGVAPQGVPMCREPVREARELVERAIAERCDFLGTIRPEDQRLSDALDWLDVAEAEK